MIALKKMHKMDKEYSAIVGKQFQALQECNLDGSQDVVTTCNRSLVAESPQTQSDQ